MSSTSQDVCELYNGTAIVRTVGRPMVKQLIYLDWLKDKEELGLFTLEKRADCLVELGMREQPTNSGNDMFVSHKAKYVKQSRREQYDQLLREEGTHEGTMTHTKTHTKTRTCMNMKKPQMSLVGHETITKYLARQRMISKLSFLPVSTIQTLQGRQSYTMRLWEGS